MKVFNSAGNNNLFSEDSTMKDYKYDMKYGWGSEKCTEIYKWELYAPV